MSERVPVCFKLFMARRSVPQLFRGFTGAVKFAAGGTNELRLVRLCRP